MAGYREMTYRDWIDDSSQAISDALLRCATQTNGQGWYENHITIEVVEALSKIGRRCFWDDCEQNIEWEPYRQQGTPERTYGDILLLVRVYLTNDRYLDGVAFYEAKRQYFSSGKAIGYRGITREQLSTLSSQTHAIQLVLYNAEGEPSQGFADAVPTIYIRELMRALNVTRLSPILGIL